MASKLKVSIDGGLVWVNADGKKHRENDKPAVIGPTGHLEYRVNGKLHRDDDKPAFIWPDGYIELWDSGTRYYLVDEKKDCGDT